MTSEGVAVGAIDQRLLAETLEALAGVVHDDEELLETFGTFFRTVGD